MKTKSKETPRTRRGGPLIPVEQLSHGKQPPRRPKQPKTPSRILAEAWLEALGPYIDLYRCGLKVWDNKIKAKKPVFLITKEHRAKYDEWVRLRAAGKPIPVELVDAPKHYHSGRLRTQWVEDLIDGYGDHLYYTSSDEGYGLPYLDTDAHDETQLPDLAATTAYVQSWFPEAWVRDSERGTNGYLKVCFGAQRDRFITACRTLQAAMRDLIRARGLTCGFEVKGTPHYDRDNGDVCGLLAKLPFKNSTWDELRAFAATPVLTLPAFERRVARIVAEAERIEEPKQEKTEAPARKVKAADRQDDESDRFGANIKHMQELARRLRRVPEIEEALEHLQSNGLFTGDWSDNEAHREKRVEYIIDHYVAPSFDPDKCGASLDAVRDELTTLIADCTEWAEIKYGRGGAEFVPGILGGRRVNIPLVVLGTWLGIGIYCMKTAEHGDGGIPYHRMEAIWNGLVARNVISKEFKFEWEVYRACRNLAESQDILEIVQRQYRPGKSMTYAPGERFPKQIAEKHLELVRASASLRPGGNHLRCATLRYGGCPPQISENRRQNTIISLGRKEESNLYSYSFTLLDTSSGPDPPD